ncbi:MAG: SIMPL domain-containing protein [Terracidiphilus sp.]
MFVKQATVAFTLVFSCMSAFAQQPGNPSLSIDARNRTLAVSAEERVTTDPDLAILHIGFETKPMDAKSAYAAGAKTSNGIIAAIKQAGIAETAIRSESQHLDRYYGDSHKFKLVQQWTVKTPPERAAEILDVAVTAGAVESGEIDWALQDTQALEDLALDHAVARARSNAAVLAKGMGVHLGALIYTTNQIVTPMPDYRQKTYANNSFPVAMEMLHDKVAPPPLAIEPRKVSRVATVYAVFAIE